MRSFNRSRTFTTVALVATSLTACTVTWVSPYNADLQQKASAMQAEVAAWDLTMRGGAGTVSDDPRYPDVISTINKWHGEAEAMLTVAASDDPGTINCAEAVKFVNGAIETSIPADLRPTAQNTATGSTAASGTATGSTASGTAPQGCEAELVASIDTGIDDIEKGLKYCRLSWVADGYFAALGQKSAAASTPPGPADANAQKTLSGNCLAEFKIASGTPATAPGAKHGRAVSALLTTLQAIVYVENRKKQAAASK